MLRTADWDVSICKAHTNTLQNKSRRLFNTSWSRQLTLLWNIYVWVHFESSALPQCEMFSVILGYFLGTPVWFNSGLFVSYIWCYCTIFWSVLLLFFKKWVLREFNCIFFMFPFNFFFLFKHILRRLQSCKNKSNVQANNLPTWNPF